MPTYEYHCDACGHEFEKFQSIKDKPLQICPNCHKKKVRRLIGSGGGILFKGSGFYQTDYRSKNYRESKKKDQTSKDTGCSSGCPKAGQCPANPDKNS